MEHVRHFFEKKLKDRHSDGSLNTNGKKHGKTTPLPAPPVDELVSKFDGLDLDNRSGKPPNAEFVGGFKQGPADPNAGRAASGPSTPSVLPAPNTHPAASATPSPPGPPPNPQMFFPTPVHYVPSNTMQHALADLNDPTWLELELPPEPRPSKPPKTPNLPARPHSDGPPRVNNNPSATPAHLTVPRPVSSPPVSKKNSRASSSGSSTPEKRAGGKNGGEERTQCSAITKKGERCSRQVKAEPPLNILDRSVTVERFCHQHRKEFLDSGKTGFYSRKTGDWVEFSKYIPGYLSPDTQAVLRVEMEKPPSQSDEPGFIYAFEIRDPDTPFLLKLKVGRTVTLEGRLNEWQKQCGSKEQVLRGWWPGNIMDKDLNTSLMKGRVQSGEKGAYCHKLERLVHLELADLVVHAPYLNKGFPNAPADSDEEDAKKSRSSTPSGSGTPVKSGKRAGASSEALKSLQQGNEPCPDCGSMHKEIFPFSRPEQGPYRGQEWEKLARPVIEKWGWFMETLG